MQFQQQARTKIVATVGPASQHIDKLRRLVAAGADVFRLNMAHGDQPQHEAVVAAIRQISEETGHPIGILVDLAGPKIRLGQLATDPLECEAGQHFQFVRGETSSQADRLVSNYSRLVDELDVGDDVMLADGTVAMRVVDKTPEAATCVVVGEGPIRSRQGINLPGVALSVPALTDDDWRHAEWAANIGCDFVSLSFVRTAREIQQLRDRLSELGSEAFVIAKIEKREALTNLVDIVNASDGIMVARGDLGVEIDVAETPMEQKRIISTCQRYQKPVIVATQMLDSMQHSRRPTRAEATDVANAILDGADACMLSGETAIGEFPVEAVDMMNRIMLNTERSLYDAPAQPPAPAAISGVHPVTSAVVYGAGRVASQLFAKMVVIATHSGATARVKSKQRDFTPTIGLSTSPATLRRLSLFWGITPLSAAPLASGQKMRDFVVQWGRENGVVDRGDRIVFCTGNEVLPDFHNLIVVHEVE